MAACICVTVYVCVCVCVCVSTPPKILIRSQSPHDGMHRLWRPRRTLRSGAIVVVVVIVVVQVQVFYI